MKRTYYDNIAQIYDQTRWLTPSVAEEVADFMINLTGATSETSFLEPGVGTGLNVLPLVKRGYSVTGIDVSEAMLAQFRQKLTGIPANLTLIHADASQLPFPDNSFDVVLTVHMLHGIANWKAFLDDITRVLKPEGVYLNCQWITPPARREFEGYYQSILSKYENSQQEFKNVGTAIEKLDVEGYFNSKGYTSKYFIAKEWEVTNTVEELLSYFKLRAYGLCWRDSDEIFHQIMNEFEAFCVKHYGSLHKSLSSQAKFEIWAYTISD
ncbi:class I SAM-dependent methyltransferase [Gloeocapsopsis dulcis]|uniref:SAM-dependent methyltransferase n=1 Tax=Gloeocapsopsis dulcis AAB1 = 1H9 TaxID=1433147 RepID=A0A6N8G5E2_9CHRO|nr:class I SAM-dependent methyltransferase [Gloeocapsopsis dulcis]MUL39425.1 SAM-dependent methyltransferase [Gloeocapsopsis dulcis AAB1 = 1H9]WNN91687.1 class I SAM-dependent methyltransferase [Gloeocapsopsis dulcis]